MKDWFPLLHHVDTLNSEIQDVVYRAFYNFVYKDIYYLLKDHDLTEDMIQESFFKAIAAIKKHEVNNLPAWVRQIARNTTLDYIRKINKNRYMLDLNDVNNIESSFDLSKQTLRIDKEIENKIRDELLHEAIAELKADYRHLIVLFYIDELSYKEIATTLDLTEQAVSQKLLRARKKLLQQFRRKWVDLNES